MGPASLSFSHGTLKPLSCPEIAEKSSRHWVRAVQSIAFTRNCWKQGQSCSTPEVQKQKEAQGIFKSLTDRSKPKFITSSLFNVVFFFTHLSLKETLLFFFFLSLSLVCSDSNSSALTNRTS